MRVRLSALAIAIAIPVAVPATPNPQQAAAADPNEKICENITMIGTRLAKRRVCATRAEWAERRQQDRDDAEEIQRSLTGSTCTGAKTNGTPIC